MTSIDNVVNLLNEAFKLDPEALEKLAFARVKCNEDLANHPTIVVYQAAEGSRCEVGLLGILNGLFGTSEERIAMSIIINKIYLLVRMISNSSSYRIISYS